MKKVFNEDQYDVEDGEDSFASTSDSIGIRTIALEQYRRCCIEGSKEMSKGGIKTRVINGVVSKIDIPDQREIFVNCVKQLGLLLTPHLAKKDDIKEKIDKVEEEINEVYDKYKEQYSKMKEKYQNEGKIDWDRTEESLQKDYYKELIVLYEEKLKMLSQLLNELNYFSESGFIGG